MWVCLSSFAVAPGRLAELRASFIASCVPHVRASPGNLDCYLMESVADPERCIICTTWETESAARSYEEHGSRQTNGLERTLRPFIAGPQVVTSYRVERALPARA